ncbi:hypothetical protein EVAR_32990_1 [Eumeta japonica]|uniref:Uncharacterized protein n=1 Tax=Eumeta variegata TaxID=151549 RepID=A0A4C1VTV7_EUMVA|nr:hypothetical protein EVAR_32990_1 [Eumeta japonica]
MACDRWWGYFRHFDLLHDCISPEEVGSASVGCFNTPYALVDEIACIFLKMCPYQYPNFGLNSPPRGGESVVISRRVNDFGSSRRAYGVSAARREFGREKKTSSRAASYDPVIALISHHSELSDGWIHSICRNLISSIEMEKRRLSTAFIFLNVGAFPMPGVIFMFVCRRVGRARAPATSADRGRSKN